MTPTSASERVRAELRRAGLVAILRGVAEPDLIPLAETLAASGVTLIEVALSEENALIQLETLARFFSDEIVIGAGTVTSAERAAAALESGARFLVTPHVVPEVNALGRKHGIEVIGGAFSPTEISTAVGQGNTFVKVFPAGVVGPAFFSGLLGPYPDLELVAVGGVTVENAKSFIAAGAVGIGVGSTLTSTSNGLDRMLVSRTATDLLEAVHRGRNM